MEEVAINIFDLDRLDLQSRIALLKGRVDHQAPMRIPLWGRENKTEVAIRFTCDILTAATICDIIRAGDRKAGDEETRAYIKHTSWMRVPNKSDLTQVVGGKTKLNPEFFTIEKAPPMVKEQKRAF